MIYNDKVILEFTKEELQVLLSAVVVSAATAERKEAIQAYKDMVDKDSSRLECF
jgi:molybdopterin synthase catalytic subunit